MTDQPKLKSRMERALIPGELSLAPSPNTMASSNYLLEIARQGAEAWNQWRRDNPEVTVNFAGVDFTLDENQGISFQEFEFGNNARFERATFGDNTNFEDTTFGNNARFEGATFGFNAGFYRATFGQHARFERATFGQYAGFDRATFGWFSRFDGATFGDGASFYDVTFEDLARFVRATFGHGAGFGGATFKGFVGFQYATFKGSVSFIGRQQRSEPDNSADPEQPSTQHVADEATTSSNLPEAGTYFRKISFSRAQFLGRASFDERDFQEEAHFSAASFAVPPDFRATKHRENLDWTGVKFAFGWYPRLGRFTIPVRGWTTQNDTITRLRRLRGVAKEIHALDEERDLFILEREAERGILWHDWWRGGWRTRLTDWWRPLRATVLMFLYRYSSNCGRSLFLPLVWLVASNWGFYHLYSFLIERPLSILVKRAVFDLTFASAVPFGATARPAFQSAIQVLFQQDSTGLIDIPWQIQAASSSQGIINLVLVFLLGLAIRSYFKFK